MQGVVGLVVRQRALEIQVIAVQVDVVFVDPAQPRHAPRVDGMDHDHGDIRWQGTLAQLLQPFDLAARAIEAFDPVSAAQRDQQPLGARITQHRHIGTQGFAERSFERVWILRQRCACRGRGGQELFTLGAIAGLGGELGLHVCLLLIFRPACWQRPYRKSRH
ncbi:hypothetical protein D3C81_716740 [compost metagenome]